MDPIAMTAPVAEVTVSEDRAQVLRRGRMALPAGISTVLVAGVSPVLADKTLVARTGPAARVVDVRCRRQALPVAGDPARRDGEVQQRLRLAAGRLARLEDEAARTATALAGVAAAGQQVATEIGQDAAAGCADTALWRAALADLAGRDQRLRLRQAALGQELEEARQEDADLRARLAETGAAPPLRAEALVTLALAAAGEVELELGYLVPGACWRPAHTARLDAGTVQWTAEGCVWQSTGEDWDGVRLRLSTERASLGVEPPALAPDLLHLRPREQVVVVEARDRAVEDSGPGGGPAAEMPGIDDGGEARVLEVAGPATLPADGRPHRFPLARFDAPASAELVVHAEVAAAAVLRTRQANPLAQPLLAGPVDLLRGGGLAGRASIAFTAPGAWFELGWGGEAAVQVRRTARSKAEPASALGSWNVRLHEVDVELANLGGEARRLLVAERVPVSELEQVRIEVDAASDPPARPDGDGMCRWQVELPANGRAHIRLRWRLSAKGGVAGL
jgi:uncharacterized protein (TIGR02231 family)